MKYIKLYIMCAKRSLISRMQYKADTFIGIFGFLIMQGCAFLSLFFIVNSIPNLQGWNIYQLGFLYGFSMLPIGFDHLFSDDLWCVSYFKVKMGQMDRYFIRPVPVLFQVIAETFQPEAFGELILAIIMMSICGPFIEINFTFAVIFLIIITTIFGGILITSFKIMIASLAFKFKRSGPLLQIIYNFTDYTKYPIKIYPHFLRIILYFIIPFGFVIFLPVETILFNTYNAYLLSLCIIGISLLFLAISIFIWSKFIKCFESSGS